jgi:dihydroflavonol-4-reductase
MVQKNLALVTGANGFMELGSKLTGKAPLLSVKDAAALILFFWVVSTALLGQDLKPGPDAPKGFVSIETDPAFWVGTLPNGLGFDANVNFRLAKLPRLRFGILGYSGKWGGAFGKTILLTKDFTENNWITQWNGVGIEVQYQCRLGLKRGGLQPGLRMQWNQFIYTQSNSHKGEANHFVLTPQIGFQWFPFTKTGLYILPWAGVQIPTIGTDNILIDGAERATRKLMPVVTAHIGWELPLRAVWRNGGRRSS